MPTRLTAERMSGSVIPPVEAQLIGTRDRFGRFGREPAISSRAPRAETARHVVSLPP